MDSDGFIKNLQKAKAKLAWLADRLDPDAEEYQNCMKHIAKLDCELFATLSSSIGEIL